MKDKLNTTKIEIATVLVRKMSYKNNEEAIFLTFLEQHQVKLRIFMYIWPNHLRNHMNQESTYIEIASIDGTSNVVALRNRQPIKILTPKTHNNTCHIVATNYGGGMVQGDNITIDMKLGANTKTLLSSQANARAYKTENSKKCHYTLQAKLTQNTHLIQLNDPIVLQAQSNLIQENHFELDSSSVLVFLDWISSGRIYHGESFQFENFSSHTKIEIDKTPIAIDRFKITPSITDCESPACFHNHTTFVNLFIAGDENDEIVKQLETKILQLTSCYDPKFSEQSPSIVLSGDRINEKLFILRISGQEVSLIRPFIEELCNVFDHKDFLGFNPFKRKY